MNTHCIGCGAPIMDSKADKCSDCEHKERPGLYERPRTAKRPVETYRTGDILLFRSKVVSPYAFHTNHGAEITLNERKEAFAHLRQYDVFPTTVVEAWYAPTHGGPYRIDPRTARSDGAGNVLGRRL